MWIPKFDEIQILVLDNSNTIVFPVFAHTSQTTNHSSVLLLPVVVYNPSKWLAMISEQEVSANARGNEDGAYLSAV